MKRLLVILFVCLMAITAYAQERTRGPRGEGFRGGQGHRSGMMNKDVTPEIKEKMEDRRERMMNKFEDKKDVKEVYSKRRGKPQPRQRIRHRKGQSRGRSMMAQHRRGQGHLSSCSWGKKSSRGRMHSQMMKKHRGGNRVSHMQYRGRGGRSMQHHGHFQRDRGMQGRSFIKSR